MNERFIFDDTESIQKYLQELYTQRVQILGQLAGNTAEMERATQELVDRRDDESHQAGILPVQSAEDTDRPAD